jgi:NAD+ diphosphatase
MVSLSSPPFSRLVAALKRHKKTCTVIESSCGGLINASILAQPGASAVYYGGSIAYNTRFSKPLLLNDANLHNSLTAPLVEGDAESEKESYIRSKLEWTSKTAMAFCEQVGTHYCIAEGGAAGPTFRPKGLSTGFAVIAIAAKQPDGQVRLVEQQVIESDHAVREENMRFFADEAAKLACKVVAGEDQIEGSGDFYTVKPNTSRHHFDRATHLRGDIEKLRMLASDAKYVVLNGNTALFRKQDTVQSTDDSHNRELMFLNQLEINTVIGNLGARQETTFLGLLNDNEPIFGVDLFVDSHGGLSDTSHLIEDAIHNTLQNKEQCHFQDTRTVAPLLNPGRCDNEIVLHATALAQWQRRAPFCNVCGSATILMEGGTSRTCTGCGHRSWPRQDPSMIAVVSNRDGSKVLLGRSKRHPAKMHTALAGFVEAGETMERAVAREVYEETGIRVDEDTAVYVASQPWPFPQSTMIGFMVRADDSQTLNIDTNELVDAKWFDRSQVQLAATVKGPVMQKEVAEAALSSNPELSLLIPPKGVLARQLIDTWLTGTKC